MSTPIPDFIATWLAGLPTVSLTSVMTNPAQVGYFSSDMVVGFCRQGPLASERVADIVPVVVDLAERYHALGGRDLVFMQDTHDPEAPEFAAWPAHCVRGTVEADMIDELRALPFADLFTVVEKNSLHAALNTGFDAWLAARPQLTSMLVVGNCTDLCVYALAMHLRLHHNARNISGIRVIVPANAVDTYDLAPETAAAIGAFTHPGAFFHAVFLYHMALNGIDVVRALE